MALQEILISLCLGGFLAPLTCIQSELLGPCYKTGLTSLVEIYTKIGYQALKNKHCFSEQDEEPMKQGGMTLGQRPTLFK
jgi:hypothetical protein